ncbi:MAG: 3-hydroxyacyl-CoA dehydrogenase NAD-binding domain-containing protein [Acidobacteria bacterium]|nr:3-hydroxyacyl-CoA dehydrogenase NAD-binding domain-containing protein [Acidobacteriota bacterium]
MSGSQDSTAPVRLDRRRDGMAVVVFDLAGSAVNKITVPVMESLAAVLDELQADTPQGVVFISGKDHFCVGVDVALIAALRAEDEARAASRKGQELLARIGSLGCPTVAALTGNCLGGGYEWALACHRIVAAAETTRVGLPEVRLGILPGWGGTQRLARRLGFGPAVEFMASGRSLNPEKALARGAVDRVVPAAQLEAEALAEARRLAGAHGPGRVPQVHRIGLLGRGLRWLPPLRRMVFGQVRNAVLKRAGHHYPAPLAIVDAVEASFSGSPARGFARESDLFAGLAVGEVSGHLVSLFFLYSEAKSWYEREEAAAVDRPGTVAVLGAGVMGTGIAYLAASQGFTVVLRDVAPQALAAGMVRIRKTVARQVTRGRMDEEAGRRIRERVKDTTEVGDLAAADLIIEAVVEEMGLKKRVLAEAAASAPGAVLATNTSALSVHEMAVALPDPSRLAGLHFFNPVEKMPLVEIIAPDEASPATVGMLLKVARHLKKVPVKVADTPGFLVNRVLSVYLAEAIRLVEEGFDLAAVDRRMLKFGMPMGPLALLDQIGLDVAEHVTGTLRAAFGEQVPPSDLVPRMVAAGRTGAKSGLGFYKHEGDKPSADDEGVRAVMAAPPAESHLPGTDQDLRLLYPMVAEAARCLHEGVVTLPGEVDLAMVMGIGWPPFTGGLLRWADSTGLGAMVAELDQMAGLHGAHLAPPDALRRRAEDPGRFYPSR